MRRSDRIGAIRALALVLAPVFLTGAASPPAAASEPPRRVVSLNLCTDQLALLLAGPDQQLFLTRLAREPGTSAMTEEAARHPSHGSSAEEVFALHPDLVVAEPFAAQATAAMLRRLGLRVETQAPVRSLADIPGALRAMGALLGQEARAEALVAEFEADLAALRRAPGPRPRAALYHANGYSLGDATLAGQILAAAGFANVAAELGLSRGGRLALEQLVMAAPDLVISSALYDGASRSEELLSHPALSAFSRARIDGADWICGTPHVLRAIRALRGARP